MSDEGFLQLIGGQLPAMQAFTSGKLKIEGDLIKSQLIEKLLSSRNVLHSAQRNTRYATRC